MPILYGTESRGTILRVDTELRQADAVRAAKGLATALRQDPELGRSPPEALARSLGIPEDLVRQVLASIQASERRPRTSHAHSIKSGLAKVWQAFAKVGRTCTRRPVYFVLVTTLLAAIGVLSLLLNEGTPSSSGSVLGLHAGIGLSLLALHVACYVRHARLRYALWGGLIVWGALIGIHYVQRLLANDAAPASLGTMGVIQTVFVAFLAALQYAVIGAVGAVAGGYFAGVRFDRAVDGMPRQELLSRLFELQSRLGQSTATSAAVAPSAQRYRLVERFRRAWPLYTIFCGLGFGFLYVSLLTYVGYASAQAAVPPYLMFVVHIALMALEFALIAAVAFFSGSIWKAVAAAWLYQLSTFPALMVDLRDRIPGWIFGPAWVQETWLQAEPLRWLLIYTTGIALVVGIGTEVENRARRQKRLMTNDPAALMTEMVRIEWLLSSRAAEVTVLVVDVARSAQMKAEADPLVAEYCFREYQCFVETVCARYGGCVHSTAGDGAVVAFHETARAFEAARALQTEIETFNRTQNRLASPFRLRVGIHVGHVAAELNKVQFTEVIDFAAHAQATAPVGGIAVTGAAAAHLDKGALLPLRETIGSQALYIALQPTMDA